jgi:hypothetical protein
VTDIDNHQIRRKPILNGLINEYTHAVTAETLANRPVNDPAL